jgi:hypothetical protein
MSYVFGGIFFMIPPHASCTGEADRLRSSEETVTDTNDA